MKSIKLSRSGVGLEKTGLGAEALMSEEERTVLRSSPWTVVSNQAKGESTECLRGDKVTWKELGELPKRNSI